MELRHLRYFIAVAEELGFRRAAARLHVAQPAVSAQVRKLEQELGVALFARTRRSVSLTPAGVAMLGEARRVLRDAESAAHAARTAGVRSSSRLRVGYLADSLPASVPRALRRVVAADPTVEVEFETGTAERLLDDLRAERIDIVAGALPAPVAGLNVVPLDDVRAVAVLPSGHAHARAGSVALGRLAPERLIVLPRDANPAFHCAVVSMCRDAGLAPKLIETPGASVAAVMLTVATTGHVALVPASASEHYGEAGARFVALDDVGPAFRTAVMTRRNGVSPATDAFLEALTRASRLTVAGSRRHHVALQAA